MGHTDNPSWGVGGVVLRDGEILLVRHTYGFAKGQLLFPGGFVQNGEMPEAAVVREILEETGVTASVKNLIGFGFKLKIGMPCICLNMYRAILRAMGTKTIWLRFTRLLAPPCGTTSQI